MPILSISWPDVKAKLGDVTGLYALTHRQASMLLTLSEQLTWAKTWRVEGYDFSDKDALDIEVADLQRNLMMPVNLTDLIQYIDEIEGLLRALQSTANCCESPDPTNGLQYTDPVTDGSGNVPQNIIDAGYATGTSDWAGFDDYKCMIAHVTVDNLESVLRQLLPHFDDTGVIIGGVGTVAAIIGSVLAGVATGGISIILQVIGSVGAAAAVWSFIAGIGEDLTEDLADKVATNHDDLACAIYTADGSDGAIAAFKDKVDELFTLPEAIALKSMNVEQIIRGLYAGRYDQQDVAEALASAGYDTGDYNCVGCDNPYYEAGNLLSDGSFESASLNYGWQKSVDATVSWPTDAYEGTYCFQLGGGSGWPTRYAFQEFTIPTTGNVRLGGYAKYVGSTYGTEVYIERWNGSSWDNLANMDPTGNTSWNYKETGNVAVTEGQLMRVRIANGSYHKLDKLKVYYP